MAVAVLALDREERLARLMVRVSIDSPGTPRGNAPARAARMAGAMASKVQSGSLTRPSP